MRVSLDHTANGPQLRIEDVVTGRGRLLDPLQVQALVWATNASLEQLLDPSASGWSDADQPPPSGAGRDALGDHD